jgi:hypothetical protein
MTADPASFIRDFYERMAGDIRRGDGDEEVIDRYHTHDVVQLADGIRLDRARLVAHVRPTRKQLGEGFRVEVHDAIAADNRLAARLTLHAEMRGRPVVTEIHLFACFADDGRMRSAHQFTRQARDAAA